MGRGLFGKKQDPLLGIVDCFILAQEFDHCCITGEPTVLKSHMTWFKVDPETIGECEVIGSIHDNPELLEASGDE